MAIITFTIDSDIGQLASDMREEDQYELKAMLGLGPTEGLRASLDYSDVALSVLTNDMKPVVMYGGTKVGPSTAMVWLLCANGIEDVSLEFLRGIRSGADDLHRQLGCELLYNYTAVKNTFHHKLLDFAKFHVDKEKEYNLGLDGEPFYALQRYKELS